MESSLNGGRIGSRLTVAKHGGESTEVAARVRKLAFVAAAGFVAACTNQASPGGGHHYRATD